MRWEKRGFIFKPDGSLPWAKSHAYIPIPDPETDPLRVYLTMWDDQKIGRVGYVDLDPDTMKVLNISREPVFDIGSLGHFDDHGVTCTGICTIGKTKLMLYAGWQLGVTVPYYLNTGMAIQNIDTSKFDRLSAAPYLGQTGICPCGRTSASFVVGEKNTIVYSGMDRWVYHTKYKRYWPDGHIRIQIEQIDRPILLQKNPGEFWFAKPWMIYHEGIYYLWFCYRTEERPQVYTIGFAWSKDGINFKRSPDVVLPTSEDPSAFDSNDVSHVAVAKVRDRWVMFYMGNNFGEEGFGYAEANSLRCD